MSVKFRLYQNQSQKSSGYKKWYGRAVVSDTIDTDQLAEKIVLRCTVHTADVQAVLKAIGEVMREELQQGNRVRLDNVGSFKVGMNTLKAEKAEDFDVKKNVKRLHVIFLPETSVVAGKRVKTLLSGIKVAELPKYDTGSEAAPTANP